MDSLLRSGSRARDWPKAIRMLYRRKQAVRLIAEGRFLLTLGLLICICTTAIDALLLPEHLMEGIFLRMGTVAPFTLAGLIAVRKRRSRFIAMFTGASLIAFAMVVLYQTQHLPPNEAARYLIGLAILPGLAMLSLPFSRRGLVQFAMGYAAAFLAVMQLWTPQGLAGVPDVIAILMIGLFATHQLVMRHEDLRQRAFLLDLRGQRASSALVEANRQLRQLSERDPLTGIPNRRHFEHVFEERFSRPGTGEERTAVMMIDLDHFKRFNDRHGHQAGDQCLRNVTHAVEAVLRKHEAVFTRYGGEEFVLAMRQMRAGEAEALANRICEAVSSIPGRGDGSALITTSIGLAVAPPGVAFELEDMIEMADAALYSAKRAGRNRFETVDAGDMDDRLCA